MLDQSTLDVLKKFYQINPPATEEQITKLIAAFPKTKFPPDYLEFLRFSNGAMYDKDFLLLEVFPIDTVIENTAAYQFQERLPGLCYFATRGEDAAYCFDPRYRKPKVIYTGFSFANNPDNAEDWGNSFSEFLPRAIDPEYQAKMGLPAFDE